MLTRYVLGFLFLDNPADPNLLNVVLIHKASGPPSVIGRWNGHGGEMDDDETPTGAMVRKTREELQVETSPEDWMPFGELRGDGAYGSYVVYLFAGRMPEGQVATQGGREQVGVHVAAECVGAGYVSNVPVLLQAAELALFEPVWFTLLAMKDAGAVRRRLAVVNVMDGVMGRGFDAIRAFRPVPDPVIGGPVIDYRELLGGHFDFGDGVKRPIVPNTEGTWTYHPERDQRLSHIAILPLGQQPDPNCVLRDEEGNPIAGLGLAGSYPRGFVPPMVTGEAIQFDDTIRLQTSEDLQEATATLIPPPAPFVLDIARYHRSTLRDCPPDEDGSPMAVASCWTDWRALATDLEEAGMPPELVDAVGVIGEEDFDEDGAPVQETSLEELKLSEIYDGHAVAIVAREFISGRREWLDMRLRPDQLTIIEEPSPDEGPFTFTRILGDVRLSTSARGTNMPDLPGIRWAAKGEAAGHENERTVKADWGIAFDGEREAICYVTPNSGPGQAPFEKVQLFWHGGPSNRNPIDWPFVEDSADQKHFEALGFRVIKVDE